MAGLIEWADLDAKRAVEETPLAERWPPATVYQVLSRTAAAHADRPAVSFQLRSGPDDQAETLDWATLHAQVTRAANMFRDLGIGPDDTVAYLLPNAPETVLSLLGGMTAGRVAPINPLLEVEQITAILRETKATLLVSLAPFPKTDLAQKARAAAAGAGVGTLLEVDLRRHLPTPLSLVVGLTRLVRRTPRPAGLRILDFQSRLARHDGAALAFEEPGGDDRIAALFHTGGTTGTPKVAQHRQRGMVYNGRIPALHMIGADDVLLCPLPLFHVFAAYPILMTCLVSGAHFVMPTPAGYRGEGVMGNFWALCERWGVTLIIMVPTAASALMQRKVDADLSRLRWAICGSAPLPVGLFNRFEKATGVKILEGYGLTEATCLVSINPPHGERKIGSVGLPIPYTEVKILACDRNGSVHKECGPDQIGEICVAGPGVFPGYLDKERNRGLFARPGGWLRTGDLGRIDADGYIWITGRAKDLIIRGGHNIDPALIEETLCEHPDVLFAGAIGQPDAHSGELPCAYVELRQGSTATPEELTAFVREHIPERAAIPRHIEVLDELPKTAVGKVFKPELRKRAITRVLGKSLAEAGIDAEIAVAEDPKKGLVAQITPRDGSDEAAIAAALDAYAIPWRLNS